MARIDLATAAAVAAAASAATTAVTTATAAAADAADAVAGLADKVDVADAAELVAGGTLLTLGETTSNDPPLAISTDTVQALRVVDGKLQVPYFLDGEDEVLFAEVDLAGLLALVAIEGVPGAPTGLTATPGIGEVEVDGTAPVDEGDSAIIDYYVDWRIGSGAWTAFAHTPSATLPITVTGLTAGTLYEFRARAVNTQGPGPWSSPTATATPTEAPSDDQWDDFNREDAGVLGVSPDGRSWDVTPLPIEDDGTGADSAGWSVGITDNHMATQSQPGGGAYLYSREAPATGGWYAQWTCPATGGSVFSQNTFYVAFFVDRTQYMFVRNDQLLYRNGPSGADITTLSSGSGYGYNNGMVVGIECNSAQTQVRFRIAANEPSWPAHVGSWSDIPAELLGERTAGVMSKFVIGGTPEYLHVDEFHLDVVA